MNATEQARFTPLVASMERALKLQGKAKATKDAYARAEVLPKDTLQLQAISWSDIPTERITIIAGQILREGQTIDGYSVIAIRPEDVILEKAGKWWKLVYGSN